MSNKHFLPAIRSKVGDWIFYSTSLTFNEVNRFIKQPDEIHERKGLSTWIQREAIETHSKAISDYINDNEQRFLGALVVGVYEGSPNWVPLDIAFDGALVDVPSSQKECISDKLGFLTLSGVEKIFAIDGQHRVAGIKKSVTSDVGIDFDKEEVTTIFVSHDSATSEGKLRTRRLFTTLNKKAKRISKSAQIALDEDNGFAIVTRNIIDEYWLFEDSRLHISYTSTGSIRADSENTITSVVGLYEIVRDLYSSKTKSEFEGNRPSDFEIKKHTDYCIKFFDYLIDNCAEYNNVFKLRNKKASYFRINENHLLFRPIGQRVLARALSVLVNRGEGFDNSMKKLLSVDFNIRNEQWNHIVWNPIDKKMISNRIAIAESQLLTLAGFKPESKKKENDLNVFLKEIKSQ
ncbi:TPA: DGQHR domain-containing protein [Vibrio cholerae]|uniref:DNA sulfur modification protein DndB n=1 Tax=Vibrio TaxID=662 RepID=UPI00028C7002|nr:DNA sulfur modification protein DndB [Vibrio cholerae]EJL6396519.1 DGQHR domain-containing protein [Vibrio navarrensis]AOY46590.1 hypothetical protein NH62_20331 [Vibrio cholerae]AOY50198.1 hypothetical protein AP033_20332 [Vibrio cholerae]EKG72083.1 DGQHR domain protein [Vibrio cholerae CP1037(10)]MCX9577879.1 DGQHR domain-containing protein [Vibrio cholerae]